MFKRTLSLPIGKQSFFLFGPRQTGKTTLIRSLLTSHDVVTVNLLETDTFLKYAASPSQLRREIEFWIEKRRQGILFVDEIQRLPILLNEIQVLMDSCGSRLSVVMTGSSARKLRRTSANLLGGRAWSFSLFPLTHVEIGKDFRLDEALAVGTLPPVAGTDRATAWRTLKAYSQTYLAEEVLQEALVRNMPAFSRFLELAADTSGSPVNYSNVARETGVASKTIREYYQVLEDTLLTCVVRPYLRSARKRLTVHPVYYLFDVGVLNSLCGRTVGTLAPGTSLYGRLFEHFVVLETHRLSCYTGKDWPLSYWRTSGGAEVDLVIEADTARMAVEIKSADRVHAQDLRGLRQFLEDYPGSRGVCVCTAERPYRIGEITCLPWREFFAETFGLQPT